LCPALRDIITEQLPSHGGILPLNWLLLSSSTAKDGALTQNVAGIFPTKLLLLALSTTRLLIDSQVVDGNSPVNKLLEMFSTLIGRTGVEDGSSWRFPLS
jgi:hypothetical protein